MKDSRVSIICRYCKKEFRVYPYRKNIALFCSYYCKGKSQYRPIPRPKIHPRGMLGKVPWNKNKHGLQTPWNKGKKSSEKTRKKLRESRKKINPFWNTPEYRENCRQAHLGEKSHYWKGGLTPINKRIRNSAQYDRWRKSIFARDNWTCVLCKKHGVYLEADHIKPFAFYPKLRFDINNGRTLCKECHLKTDTYAQRANLSYAAFKEIEDPRKGLADVVIEPLK